MGQRRRHRCHMNVKRDSASRSRKAHSGLQARMDRMSADRGKITARLPAHTIQYFTKKCHLRLVLQGSNIVGCHCFGYAGFQLCRA